MSKPKLKDGVSVMYREVEGQKNTYEVNFLIESSSIIIPFEMNDIAFQCLKYLDGNCTVEDLSHCFGLSVVEVKKLIRLLESYGLICSKNMSVDKFKYGRFSSQVNFFSGFEGAHTRDEMQGKICKSHVVILGIGGIGSWIAYSLVLAGVGTLTLIDNDVVEMGNLNRQCLYDRSEVGNSKALVLGAKLQKFDSDLEIKLKRVKISSTIQYQEIMDLDVDLVINCADEPEMDTMNRIVSEACFATGTPHILCGGYDGHLGFIGPTVIPGESGCWFCYEQTLDHQLLRAGYKHLTVTPSQVKGGTLGAISSIVANYHVLDAIKVLSGFSRPTFVNKVAEVDFLTYGINFRKYGRIQNCSICREICGGENDQS